MSRLPIGMQGRATESTEVAIWRGLNEKNLFLGNKEITNIG
jgi:hypothetical protein